MYRYAYDYNKESFMEYDDDLVEPISLSIMKRAFETNGNGTPYLYFYCKV